MDKSVTSTAIGLLHYVYSTARRFDSDEGIEKYLSEARAANSRHYELPFPLFMYKCKFDDTDIGGVRCIILTPAVASNDKMVFMHGGGNISRPSSHLWSFLDQLAVKSRRTIVVPLFSLLPDHGRDEIFAEIVSVWNSVSEQTGPGDIALAGESSGGGLALSLAQHIRDHGGEQPGNIVLMSPMLDAEMADPECDDISLADPVKMLGAMRAVGRIWAEGDFDDYRSSPIRGDLTGLAPIMVIVGSNESVLPYCRMLVRRSKAVGVPICSYEYHGMPCGLIIFSSPESIDAAYRIAETLNGTPIERNLLIGGLIRPRITVEGDNIPDDTIRIEGRSLSSSILERFLFHAMGREKYTSEDSVAEFLEICRIANERPYEIPGFMVFKSKTSKSFRCGMEVYEFTPKNPKKRKHILYIHGGSFTSRPTVYHWNLIDRLAQSTGQAVTVPLYPLLPAHTFKEARDDVFELYDEMCTEYPADKISIISDSAGGGISVILAQWLAATGRPQPKCFILISPGLDFSMNNPEIKAVADSDPMLMPEGIIALGHLWSGGLPLDDPSVSPLHGDMSGIKSEIVVFTGTNDILNPDARRLRDIAAQQGKDIVYFEYQGLPHDFLLMPLPEAREALSIVKDIVDRRCA
jgi:epsilon-lactone hydrolase